MSRTPVPRKGCFQSSYPSTEWQEVPCTKPPPVPYPPRIVGGASAGFSAQSTGFTSATGSFTIVSNVVDESGQVNGQGPLIANAFSLQLNTNHISSQLCQGTSCVGWQQFIYSNLSALTSCSWDPARSCGQVYIQYWLLNFGLERPRQAIVPYGVEFLRRGGLAVLAVAGATATIA
jgi:hypothetical protein